MADYRELDGLNQSLLKKILVSPAAFLKQRDQQGDSEETHFVFGSLVDDMLLGDFDLDEKYYVLQDSDISQVLKNITQYVFDYMNTCETPVEWDSMDTVILQACNEYEYQSRWKDETRVNKIKTQCLTYFQSLYAAAGKKIVSEEEYYKATVCIAALKTDDYTKKHFSKAKDVESWNHKVITFQYKGYDFKGELDKVFIDHTNKTIEPIDYKTTGSPITSFNHDFWKFRYDFQAAVYFFGISQDPEVVALVKKGYKLLHFKYIVVEKEMNNPPMVHKVTNAVSQIGWSGGTLSSGRKLEGFLQALERFTFHQSTDQWKFPMEYYKNGYLDIRV